MPFPKGQSFCFQKTRGYQTLFLRCFDSSTSCRPLRLPPTPLSRRHRRGRLTEKPSSIRRTKLVRFPLTHLSLLLLPRFLQTQVVLIPLVVFAIALSFLHFLYDCVVNTFLLHTTLISTLVQPTRAATWLFCHLASHFLHLSQL